MQHSPSCEAKRFPANQEISSILWNTKVHCHVDKSLLQVPILSQINPVHAPSPFDFMEEFNPHVFTPCYSISRSQSVCHPLTITNSTVLITRKFI